jgi:APA family basic amino acid/polyamine antiporter
MNAPSRPIGFWTATALVTGNMIGSGLFLLPSSLAPFGAASLLGWAASAIGAMLLAVVFARLGRLHSQSGGPYAFARHAFGDFVGYFVAWSYWVSIWCSVAAIAIAFTGYAGSLVPALSSSPLVSALCAAAVVWICTGINLLGLRAAGGTQLWTTVAKVGALVLFVAVAAFYVDAKHFKPFNPTSLPSFDLMTATATLTLWAFLGLECATIPAGEVRDPEKTVPRATLTGTAIAIVVTIAACTAVMGLVPATSLARSTAPFADAMQQMLGTTAGQLTAALAALACFGALNGWVLLLGQLPLAVARDGLFPLAFAKQDRNGTPRVGLVIGSVLATVLVLSNYTSTVVNLFTWAILLSTAAALLPFVVCAAALLRLERTHALITLAATMALVYACWALLLGAGTQALIWGTGLLLAGIPMYVWQRARNVSD